MSKTLLGIFWKDRSVLPVDRNHLKAVDKFVNIVKDQYYHFVYPMHKVTNRWKF